MILVTVEVVRSSRSAVARKYNHFWGNNTMADMTEHEREVLNKLRDCPQISWKRIRKSKLKTFFVYHYIFIAVFDFYEDTSTLSTITSKKKVFSKYPARHLYNTYDGGDSSIDKSIDRTCRWRCFGIWILRGSLHIDISNTGVTKVTIVQQRFVHTTSHRDV